MSSSTWQEHFKDKLAGFEPPSEGSALEAALVEGRFEEADYLAWASQTHAVPIIQDTFFTETEPDTNLIAQRPGAWNERFFPVNDWEGHLVIAVHEVPTSVPQGASVALASREMLAQWWERLAPHMTSNEGIEGISLDAPAGLSAEAEPDGFTATMQTPAPLNFTFAGVGLAAAAPAPVSDATQVSVPDEEATQAPTSGPAPTSAVSPLVSTGGPTIVSDATIDVNALPVEVEAIPFPTPAAGTHFRTAEEVIDSQLPTAKGQYDAPATNAPLIEVCGDVARASLLSPLVAAHPQFAEEVRRALTSIGSSYQKTMFLALDDQKKGLVPLLWSKNFGEPTVVPGVPLGQASIFEIVATTEKPFHGPVVENDINKNFFFTWNDGTAPVTATLVPFFFQHRFSGVLLAFGPAEAYNLPLLRHVEKVCEELTQQLGGAQEHSVAA